jgi:CHAT domain-containing protein
MTGDGSSAMLTLKDLLELKLAETEMGGIRLAVLSACETGLVGIELADEAIGLPTGLLQAGVAGVVASLWSVSELSTTILLIRFYDLWRKEGREPAVALHHAQYWMRDTTSQQKAEYFQDTNPDIFYLLILLEPDHFSHPFYWAAFTYVGV